MTQALQIPMLMLSSDTMLKPDSAAAGNDTASYENSQSSADDAVAFGQLLSGMVEPGKNGKASVGQRQIPAGIANLSSLSAALRQSETAEQADDSLLANNLLQQIALVLQGEAQEGSEQTNKTEGDAVLSDVTRVLAQQVGASDTGSSETDKSTSAPDTLLKGEPEASSLKTELTKAAQQIDLSNGATSVNSNDPKQKATTDAAISASADAALNASDATQSAADDSPARLAKLSQQATDAHSHSEKTEIANLNAKATDEAAVAKANSADVVTSGVTDDDAAKATSAQITQLEQVEDTLLTQTDKKPLAEHGNDKATSDKKSASVAANSIKDALLTDSEVEKPASVSAADAAAMRSITPASATHSQTNAARNAAEPASDNAQQKMQPALQVAQSDNGSATEGDSRQQNQAERQFTADLNNAFSRSGSDSSQTRTEHTFTSTLQHVQQTTRSSDASRPQLKTVSEQLQQSLNLQQHDAAGQLRERVNLMVRQNIQIAEIRLDPAGLGQMQIKVDVQQDQTNVQFVVQQSQAKELIEQQLPRLREMLQQQGIVLGEGSVQQQSQQERQLAQGQQQQNGQAGGQHGEAADGIQAEGVAAQVKVATPDRLVDYYA